jgi:hypothetical protein
MIAPRPLLAVSAPFHHVVFCVASAVFGSLYAAKPRVVIVSKVLPLGQYHRATAVAPGPQKFQ